jgi:polysaccharide deacetylase family protein (PEP-CTERM system associated)
MAASRLSAGRLHLSVDVEEWFDAANLQPYLPPDLDRRRASRVVGQVHSILRLLARHDARATFFVLGTTAQRHAGLARTIAAAGHEVASHGMTHRLLTQLSPAERLEEALASKRLLEDQLGAEVVGFRAPCFAIDDAMLLQLEEVGYRYDSSLLPTSLPGRAGRLRQPVESRRGHGIRELPLPAAELMGLRLPIAGGAYARFLPPALLRRLLRHRLAHDASAILYVHPWEMARDYRLPPATPAIVRLRHLYGIGKIPGLLDRLLAAFGSTPLSSLLDEPAGRSRLSISAD